jgi:ABC-type transporter Mla subunit MlaD
MRNTRAVVMMVVAVAVAIGAVVVAAQYPKTPKPHAKYEYIKEFFEMYANLLKYKEDFDLKYLDI